MVIQTELGLLRRTHYSVQLHEASGKSATVMGWISAVRGHGNISFVTIRDNKGSIQVVAKAGACPDDVREKLSSLKPVSRCFQFQSVPSLAAKTYNQPAWGGTPYLYVDR